MFIPDVINTLLMGLIFMVVIVTIVRPFVLNLVGTAVSNSDMQKAAIDAVEREMIRKAELFEAQRADKIKYQMMLLEKPEKPKPKPVIEPEPEPEVVPEPVAEVVPTDRVSCFSGRPGAAAGAGVAGLARLFATAGIGSVRCAGVSIGAPLLRKRPGAGATGSGAPRSAAASGAAAAPGPSTMLPSSTSRSIRRSLIASIELSASDSSGRPICISSLLALLGRGILMARHKGLPSLSK